MMQLHLASRSPRRAAFLTQLGLRFSIVVADVPEVPAPGQSPQDYALQVALAKARAGVANAGSTLPVMGADTDVSIDGDILGKPRDRDDAIRMLLRLSGRTHEVHSAVALVQGSRVETAMSTSLVTFTRITPAEAAAYCDTGEPLDKAGAYAVQGGAARWVRAINGSHSNIVGLPLAETVELLARFDIACSFPAQHLPSPDSARGARP
jgi:septum formation protein